MGVGVGGEKREEKFFLIKNHRNMVFFLANNQINEIC